MGKNKKKFGHCTVCNEYKPIAAWGMCWKHYARWKRHNGDVSDPEYINTGKTCKQDGCDEDAKVDGYCGKHYSRILRHGDPTVVNHADKGSPPLTFNRYQCVVSGCKDEISAKELCYKHYHNYMYHTREGNVDNVFDYLRLREDNPL